MAQWGQGQPGFQYPMQTGFQPTNPQYQQNPQFQQPQFQQNPQFQPGYGPPGSGVLPQRTGYPVNQGMQPQPTGFPGNGAMQPQPTGYPGPGSNFSSAMRPAPPPPVPPIPAQYQQNQSSFLQPQQSRGFLSPSPGLGGPGLSAIQPQQTGYPAARPLVPQVTGYMDPRLQMMSSTFLPMNPSTPYSAGGAPQLPSQLLPGGLSLQQSFQQHNQEVKGTAAPRVPWALSKQEKKNYDNIFRAWDTHGDGFISGQTALDVFGQSGLSKDDLARIWTLADVDDRGKLNKAEFHVAMGLIYRKLNGNEIPEQLPPELVPPSHRDLDSSVDFLKGVLKNETRSRSPSSIDSPVSRLKDRSFTGSSALDSGRDATIYRHSDNESSGGVYQPRSRHINRDNVRSRNETGPSADLADVKNMLANTAQMLDRAAEADSARTAEDEALDREMEDLKYRVKRVGDDLDYVSRGPRTSAKDEERRKLERELLSLMHERVPEVERKIKARDERKEREKRQWARDRDDTNRRFGRYDDKDESYSSSRRYDDDRDRPYSRGSYRRGYGDDYGHRTPSPRDRRDREYDRPRTPAAAAAASLSPSPATTSSAVTSPPPAARAPSSPAPAKKNMTPEERQAFARAEAQRRIEARKAALGLVATPSPAPIDTTVEDRLQQEKKEAEEKARAAEKEAEERENLRKERLQREKALKEESAVPAPPVVTPPAAKAPPLPPTRAKAAPPPPKPRGTAPAPPPARAQAARPPAPVITPPAPAPPLPPAVPEVDPEEEAFRAREEAIKKQREARAARLRQLEQEEEEARLEEEKYQAKLQAFKNKPAPSPVVAAPSPAPPAPAPLPAARAPVPPVVSPPVAVTNPSTPAVQSPPAEKPDTNPFSRLIKGGGAAAAASPAAASSGSNPWSQPVTSVSPPVAAPTPPLAVRSPRSPGPVPVKTPYNTAPPSTSSIGDDWDVIKENSDSDDDSSDDEITKSRSARNDIASKLFGSLLPRPQSTPASSPSSPAPDRGVVTSPPPPPPPGPPPPPAPPVAPVAPPAPAVTSSGPGDVSALMLSIQGGRKLRATKTVDKSGPPVAGRVIGDSTPPSHINTVVRAPSPPRIDIPPPAAVPASSTMDSELSSQSNRQSVAWYAGLATEAGNQFEHLPSTREEDETEAPPTPIPVIQVEDDPLADIDKSQELRVRTLYAYVADGPDDLSFDENVILKANPSKSDGDWWFGTVVTTGKSGLFPRTYVEATKFVKAKALYTYTGNGSDELSFSEGDMVSVVDDSEDVWWKVEQDGAVFLAPADYLEVAEDPDRTLIAPVFDIPAVQNLVEVQTSQPKLDSTGDLGTDTSDDDMDADTETDGSDYLSFAESDIEDTYPETKAEREAREHERQLVLEAAGLIVKQDVKPPPRPPRKPKSGKRRPPPLAPERLSSNTSASSLKGLPPVPPTESETSAHLNDAFDRYEAFRYTHANANRMSVASSMDSAPPSSPTLSAVSQSPSKEGESRYSSIMHFLGRKTPEAEKRLVISAPILNSPETEFSRSASPAFGSSWASLVDKSALEGIPPKERRRQEAIFELIATETAYVHDLQLVVEHFYSNMLSLLDMKAVTVVFANVEDILIINTTFMSALEERQKDCRLYIDKIGDVLQSHMSNMAVYMEYCVNQSNAIKVLQSLRDTRPDLAARLQHLRDDPAARNLDLSSYLLIPMQRITRYPLLVKQILHYTEPGGAEHIAIVDSLRAAERILAHINETIREQEGRETLREISQHLWIGQGRLDLTAPTRYMGARTLVKDGILCKAKSGRRLHAFLCSDTLVLTDATAQNLYRMPISLSEVRLKDGNDDLCFQVTLPYPRGGEAVGLRASSVRECQLWMQAIESASRKCIEAEKKASRRVSKAR
ncbi:hypothetical protein EDD18DRAFT_1080080 [Armillaria luteobubalina]|uniref:Actin cytoskeleton-regulatory complex protein pan1 n=1 Tax=Armillaria luteobubalina TaxID=153913 RepID=A0AA39PYI5_9AGAR|nr:hypothetical protein EDD18DRAFT_1080080 [Armillaria luteobubalina]